MDAKTYHDFCKNANIRAQDSPVFRLATRLSPSRTQCNILALLALGFKVIDISICNRVFTGDRYTSGRGKKKTLCCMGTCTIPFPGSHMQERSIIVDKAK